MNIFGEGLPDEIRGQIDRRQQTYGSGYANSRNNEEIIALNANTGWIKLLSSVNIPDITKINNPSIKQLNLEGDALARTYVLFNGTEGNTDTFRSGISPANTFGGGDYAYGIGGTEFGLNPMMGITSMTVNHENRGSLRRAVVKIRAHNKVQFEIIDVLYLRLGFSVLLEWGNSIYFDNNDVFQSNPNNSLGDEFLNGVGSYETMLQKMHKKRLDSHGNYDAMFAKVANFHWSVNKDGSYDIEVNLSSIGDIIESLKVNVLLGESQFQSVINNNIDTKEITSDEKIELSNSKHTIGQFFDFIRKRLNSNESGVRVNEKGKHIIFSNVGTVTPEADQKVWNDIQQGEIWASPPNAQLHTTFSHKRVDDTWTLQYRWIRDIEYQDAPKDIITAKLKIFFMLDASNTLIDGSSFLALSSPKQYGSSKTINQFVSTQIRTGPNEDTLDEEDMTYTDVKDASTNPDGIGNTTNIAADIARAKKNTVNLLPAFNFNSNQFETNRSDALMMIWNEEESEYYIRLGIFLQFLQNVIMLNQKTKATDFVPSLRFDFDMYSNLMYVNPNQVSVDPRICMVNRSLDKLPAYFAIGGNKFIEDKLKISNAEYGRIMNIYVNFVFILDTIESKKEKDGTIVLIDFLQEILNGITKALSGINDLDVFIEETTTTVKIIDKNPLPNKEKVLEYIKSADFEFSSTNSTIPTLIYEQNYRDISTKMAIFQLFGYNNSSAGFIKDFTFKTELTPAFSTMITVGASARGEVVGANETALSRINKGLEDRYKVEMKNGNSPTTPTTTTSTDDTIAKLQQKYNNTLTEYSTFLKSLSTNGQVYNKENIDNFQPVLSNLISTENQIEKLKNPTTSSIAIGTGFIPFNLSLTMDGLSGMKINEKFTVNTDFLPSNYPGNVEFLIKNLSHEVANNKWLTKIDSYCIASGNFEGQKSFLVKGNAGGGGSGGGSGGSGGQNKFVDKIILHHTVTDSFGSSFGALKNDNAEGRVHYAINYDGTISKNKLFDTVGMKEFELRHFPAANDLNKNSISIEIATDGRLNKYGGRWKPGDPIPTKWYRESNNFSTYEYNNKHGRDVVQLTNGWEGTYVYSDYTDAQMASLITLINEISSRHPEINFKGKDVWATVFGTSGPTVSKHGKVTTAGGDGPGIYSHGRAKKGSHVDCFPSNRLLTALLKLGMTGSINSQKILS